MTSTPMSIDARGPRFSATITSAVLALVLITGSGWLLFAQMLVFAIAVVAGLRYGPYGLLYRYVVQPRLGPTSKTEAEAGPRFAQGVGLVMSGIGVLCFAAGAPMAGLVITAFTFVATFLNAAFDFCLGCHMYLILKRFRTVA